MTLKIKTIDTGKYVHRCGLIGMANRKIAITLCCVFLFATLV